MTTEPEVGEAATREELGKLLVMAAGLPSMPDMFGEATLEELGLDSLAAMELQVAVQDCYRVQIPDEALGMSVPDITRYVVAHIQEGS